MELPEITEQFSRAGMVKQAERLAEALYSLRGDLHRTTAASLTRMNAAAESYCSDQGAERLRIETAEVFDRAERRLAEAERVLESVRGVFSKLDGPEVW